MDQKQESLIEYPCDFPIKVMCVAQEGLIDAISAVAMAHDPHFKPESIATRPSSKGNYMGLTITVHATSREQLDSVYMALSSHPMVKMVL
jgi:putative lipoic acid-binding regulatory protein